MSVDEPGAIPMFVDRQRVFIDQNDHTFLVLHKTASGGTAQDVAHFFANDPRMASSHYVIGQDGTVVQVVQEVDGAAANCCLESGHASFLPLGINLNVKTVSIEHCDPATDNSTPLTDAQKAASFRLVKHICERHNIPKRRSTNDGQGGIIGHNDIAPLSRARCPGNYPWTELFAYLQGGNQPVSGIPPGWHDDGHTLTSPSPTQGGQAVPITGAIRAYILGNAWDYRNVALAPAFHTNQFELSNANLGAGVQQLFRWAMLCVPDSGPSAGKVIWEWTGVELAYTRDMLAKTTAEIAALQAQLKAAEARQGIPENVVTQKLQALLVPAQDISQRATELVAAINVPLV